MHLHDVPAVDWNGDVKERVGAEVVVRGGDLGSGRVEKLEHPIDSALDPLPGEIEEHALARSGVERVAIDVDRRVKPAIDDRFECDDLSLAREVVRFPLAG